MIIALPPGHDHLANALVRDLGFTKAHVDAEVRRFLVALDPLVEAGAMMVNMGRSPRLSSRLEAHGGDWDRATLRAPEMDRLVAVARELLPAVTYADKTVVVGDGPPDGAVRVAIAGRGTGDHLVAEGSIPDQEAEIVAWVRSLDEPTPTRRPAKEPAVAVLEPVAVADDPFA